MVIRQRRVANREKALFQGNASTGAGQRGIAGEGAGSDVGLGLFEVKPATPALGAIVDDARMRPPT